MTAPSTVYKISINSPVRPYFNDIIYFSPTPLYRQKAKS